MGELSFLRQRELWSGDGELGGASLTGVSGFVQCCDTTGPPVSEYTRVMTNLSLSAGGSLHGWLAAKE